MKSMRKGIIFPLSFLLLFSLILPLSLGENGTGEMKIFIDKTSVTSNETFTVSIYINSSTPVNLAEASITFDANLMEALSVEDGGLFDIWMDSLMPGFIIIDNVNGSVKYMMGISTTSSPVSGIFANITFKAKDASGVSTIDFIANVSATCFGAGTDKWLPSLTPATIMVNPVDMVVESLSLVGGSAFTVNITVDPHGQTMSGASCILHFDPAVLQVSGFDYGTLFSGNIGGTTPVDNVNGTIGPIAAFDLGGVSTAGTLISITFLPQQTGFSYLNLTNVEVKDMNNSDMGAIATNSYVEVDADPPQLTFEVGEPYYNDWISFSTPIYMNATDAHDYNIYYRIWNGSWQAWQTGLLNTDLLIYIQDEGLHYVEYYASDSLGNTGSIGNVTLYVDNTPPETDIALDPTSPNGENGWYISSVTVNLTATDGECGVDKIYYRIDGGAWTEYISEFIISEDGAHTIYYYAVDNVGNEKAVESKAINIDKAKPILSYALEGTMGNNDWYKSTVTVTLNATDEASGIAEFKYRTNGEWHDYATPFQLGDGVYTVEFYAKDMAGNENTTSFDLKVDKTAPTSSHTLQGTYEDGKYTSDVTVKITASDNLAGVKQIYYRLDGGNWQTFLGTSGTDTVSAEGVHTIEYYAVDNAGNKGATHQATFEILKNKPPVADFNYTPAEPTDVDNIKFNANSSYDPDGSIVNYTWDFGDGTKGYGKIVYHKYEDNGTYMVTLTVKDDKGTENTVKQQIVVANVPPTARISYLPEEPKIRKNINFTSLSYDSDGSIVNYTWDFGDGNISYEENPVHAYAKIGTYNVTLVVTDDDGATGEITIKVKVTKEEVNTLLYIAIIVILVVVAIAVVAIWKKRTKS